MAAAAIPAIVGAYGAWQSHKDAQNASKLSPIEQQGQKQQVQAGQQLGQQGAQLQNYGMPKLQQAGTYYSSLASGNRATTGQALAPDVANLNSIYGGTQRTLTRFLRGPDRDYARGELERQRAGSIAGLFTGARARGVEGLSALGQYGVSQGTAALSGSAGIGAGLSSAGAANRFGAAELQRQAGGDAAGFLFQLLKSGAFQRGRGTTNPGSFNYGPSGPPPAGDGGYG